MIDNFFLETEDLFFESASFLQKLYTGEIPIWGYGVPCIDALNPILPKSFHLIGAKTGGGKTRFLRHAIYNLTSHNDRLVYISCEDSSENFGLKAFEDFGAGNDDRTFLNILRHAGEERKDISFSYFQEKLSETSDRYKDKNIAYKFWMRMTLDDLTNAIKKYSPIFKIWCIDYVQAIKTHGSVYDKNVKIAETLRDAAIENNIAIIGVTQLNRSNDNILKDIPPSINSIEGAGAYEQAAHSILLLHREPKDMGNYFLPTDDVNAYLFKNRLGGKVRKFKLNRNYEEIGGYNEPANNESGYKAEKKEPWWTK